MKCPFCGHTEDKVLDSRDHRGGESIKRRRECEKCGGRFNTYEEVEESRLTVIKKDQRREPFSRDKILKGMQTACEKRPVSAEALDEAVESIEMHFRNQPTREVPSSAIGEKVIDALRELDEVAFVRFASVYLQFEDVGQFRQIVDALSMRHRHRDQS